MSTLRFLSRACFRGPFVLFGCLLLAWASPAQAWWNDAWTLRKPLTLDLTATGVPISDPVGTTPVLVRLHDGNFGFANAQPDGSDLRFIAADDKTPLAFHIEKFDSLLNEAFVWVNVPDVKPGAKTTFWLYYGNTSGKAPKVESAKDTYDADTVLVYHFNEQGQPAFDFSGQGNTAQNPGIADAGAQIGSGVRLEGTTAITIPSSASLAWAAGGTMTWSAWVKFGAPQPNAVFFGRKDGPSNLLIGADSGVPFVAVTAGGVSTRSSAGPAVTPNSWHHVALVAGGGQIALFLDGDPYATLAAPLPALNGPMVLGGGNLGGLITGTGPGFAGGIDELEISRVARPAGFIKFAASEQAGDSASKLLTVGEDEQQTSWLSALKKGYLGVIIGSLTVDGWVVIGILAFMSAISWLVMISKAAYLNQVGRGNAEFLKEWRRVATDLSVLDQDESPAADPGVKRADGPAAPKRGPGRKAPLYHIYHLGIEELRHRRRPDRDGSTRIALSGRSIEAIRASLDGGMVRESQKLSSQMVLLTIAISGGPFLGLLGTVVGVMITFAAVAQAGDVNVNAIAPGIAAALAATVAGLAVAIPSLFGYNYLLTRIKSETSDMHVFIDEFVTKLAEFYPDQAD